MNIKNKGDCMIEKLREQMRVDLQLCGAKPLTQKTYLREVDNLERYFNRSPAELREAELKEYLLYLMKERHLSEGGVASLGLRNQLSCSIERRSDLGQVEPTDMQIDGSRGRGLVAQKQLDMVETGSGFNQVGTAYLY
jgi:Phage integrase, N-terminal SAM-like domain